MRYTIGLDLGGTEIKGGVLDENRKTVVKDRIATESSGGPDHVIGRLALLARRLVKQAGIPDGSVAGVGVGTPGPVDPKTQVVLMAPNLGWTNVALHKKLQELCGGWPVTVVNDANAACYGEYIAGVGHTEQVRHMVLLTLGTGIGGGIVIDGELFVGPHGAGAELGHTIVQVNGRPCPCGQRGCVERYASSTAIAAEAQRRVAAGEKTILKPTDNTQQVFEAAARGDAVACAVIDEACEYLGAAVVNFVHATDPELVVLGGGVSHGGDALLSRVWKFYKQHYWKAAPSYIKLVLATLGNDAGFIGAAGLAARVRAT